MNASFVSLWIRYTKRLCMVFGIAYMFFAIVPHSVDAQYVDEPFPYLVQWQEYDESQWVTTDFASWLIKPDTQEDTSLIKTLTRFFRLTDTQYDDPTSPATSYIKWLLNMLLGLVSFLSLVMIIFAFYLIFFSKGEEAVTKAKKILIGVGVALAIMWLSWLIVSLFFDIYGTVTVI